METITATDLARNTRAILDSVMMRGETISVERNHMMIARIVPAQSHMSATQALADLRPTLTPAQGKAWLAAGRVGFDDALLDPWA